MPVSVSEWESECCQPAPQVGDRVEWQLSWRPADAGIRLLDWTWRSATSFVGDADGVETSGTLLRSGPLVAWCPIEVAAGPATGTLGADFHGSIPDGVPSVVAHVQRVDVVDDGVLVVLELTGTDQPRQR